MNLSGLVGCWTLWCGWVSGKGQDEATRHVEGVEWELNVML